MSLHNLRRNRERFLHIMMGLVGLLFLIFEARLVHIMLIGKVNGVDLQAQANQQFYRQSVLPAKRGTIYDIGGNPIASDSTAYNVYAVLTTKWADEGAAPIHVPEDQKEHTAEVLSHHIKMSKEEILKRLKSPDATQVEFGQAGQNLSHAKMEKIKNENLQGIHFLEQPNRLYPNGNFASHVLGYAQYEEAQLPKDSRLIGQMGIEKNWDAHLAGTNGHRNYLANHDQFATVDQEDSDSNTQPIDGLDLYTTIDTRLQTYLETLMEKVYKENKPQSMTAMLVDPKTGNVVAASQRPTFNLQTRKGLKDMWTNLLVGEAYEPGSVIKVLTVAAAIQEGVFQPDETYQSGHIIVDGTQISDWNKVGWGVIPQLEGLAQSSNVLMVKLVQAMGYDTWHKYMVEFGLTQCPNSGFDDEISGSISFDKELQKANTAFGQAIRVTPWELMQAYTAVANGGKMMKLHIIDRYQEKDGSIRVNQPEQISQPISEETARKTLKALESIVYSPNGTGTIYDIKGIRLAVKTGTAEIYDENAGRYLSGGENAYLHSVVGFAPSDNPRYILYLTMKRPSAGGLAQVGLSKIFIPFLQRAMEYSKLEPASQSSSSQVPNIVNQEVNTAEQSLKKQHFANIQVLGKGKQVIRQFPQSGEKQRSDRPIFLLTEGELTMPDMTGMSLTEAQNLAQMLGIHLSVNGQGHVKKQSLSPGRPIRSEETVTIELQ